ncbi:murein transglycosylase domain-containing protein [Alteromonas lipolytica]|uniref:Transglycosylase SLT domain-containing protein n=1 Tax=Alteromonas lipolytica TaxID=1856405 RepID=A0A1E8F950_9ALTE|nr:murein transglycosylase domain-containing protein [Alteromonas lipolytica]OFI32451.1 hypothetical protein BFC17_06980 [Alteromonas lipolytica]GGF79548.1 hypothetical protein GCM10011338_34860 [Alteromonas lipolytica]
MRRVLSTSLLAVLLGLQFPASAQSVDDFDEISARMDAEFENQTKRIDDIYQAVDEAIDKAFRGLTKRIEVKWPDGALPERHRWVTYNKSMNSRAIADFEAGELVIETLVEPGEDLQEKVAELMAMSSSIATATPKELDEQDVLLQEVTKEVAEVTEEPVKITQTTDTSIASVLPDTIGGQLAGLAEALKQDLAELPALSDASKPEEISVVVEKVAQKQQPNKPVTETTETVVVVEEPVQQPDDKVDAAPVAEPAKDVVAESKAKPALVETPVKEVVTESKAEPAPQEIAVIPAKPEPKKAFAVPAPLPVLSVVEDNGQTRLQLTIEFVNGYQEKLVEEYFDDIKGYAKRYDVPVSVIMAIIETESSYNPRAVSPVPAFGLMQLVPKTAGLDAHLFVHGEKKVVSADYLFNEDNNLKLGSAYFHLLTHRYLRKISDPQARFYCAVASYNTGVGNVARTFTGRKSINAAVDTINGMSAEAVYDYLIENLPAEETKNYLRKVVTRMAKYKQFDA